MSEQQANYETRGKTIFRVEKNADNPYVMIDRRPIENPCLSWRAKGVLTYLISRPDNWIVRLGDLVKRSPEGVYAVRAALRELTKAGHITRREERDENGRFKQYVLEVREIPTVTCPPTNLPQAVAPQAVDLTLNDTNSNDTNSNDTELNIFISLFGKFHKGEKERWLAICEAAGFGKAEEIASWAHKKEIHLTNRLGLLDSLNTAAKNWKTEGRAERKPRKSAAQSGDNHRYDRGQYADFLS